MLHFMIIQYDASDTDVTYIKLASEQVEFFSNGIHVRWYIQCDLSTVVQAFFSLHELH